MLRSRIVLLFLSTVFVASLSCSKEKAGVSSTSFATIADCAGAVLLKGSSGSRDGVKGAYVETGDTLVVPADCRITVMLGRELFISCSGGSRAVVGWTREADGQISALTEIFEGEIFCHSDAANHIAAVRSPVGGVTGTGGSFGVWYAPERQSAVVAAVAGPVEVYADGESGTMLEPCTKMLISTGRMSAAVTLGSRDLKELEGFVELELLKRALARVNCLSSTGANAAPVWASDSASTAVPGTLFLDTIKSSDADGDSLSFVLLEGPSGAVIGEQDGILRFTPATPGVCEMKIQTADRSGNVAEMRYLLTVSGAATAVLRCPDKSMVGDPILLDASLSVDEKGASAGLRCRFDVDGNGTWDLPAGGTASGQMKVEYRYEKTGTFKPVVEVTTGSGTVVTASRAISVTRPLSVTIGCDPVVGVPGTAYRFEAQSVNGPVQTRWDFEGDGIWDYPASGHTDERMITHIFDKIGMRTVKMEAVDESGAVTVVSYPLMVYTGPVIKKIDCPDTVNINTEFTATVEVHNPDFSLVNVSWDPAGTGVPTQEGKSLFVNLSYKEAKAYTLVCSVTDEKGLTASETKRVYAINNATTIDAGGPYRGAVNAPITLEGLARDADNTITGFIWRYDDGTPDYTSDKIAKTTHAFKKGGRHLVRFGVKTDDGVTAWDSAVVGIENHTPIAFAGADIVSREGRSVELRGKSRDADNNVAKYEWDFEGDGTWDWSGPDTAAVKHAFKVYTRPILRVTDGEGASGLDTVNIVICPDGMETIEEGRYCIDRYEYPNKRGGEPVKDVTFAQAQSACAAQGKRLCSFDEFEMACRGGSDRNDYPYGRKYEQANCNTFGNGHVENKAAKSGEFENCKSKAGVFDMTGNVAEWTSTGADGKRVAGGWWQNGAETARCGSYVTLDKTKKYLYAGFRCCK